MAQRASAFIEQKLKSGNGTYHHNYKEGVAANPAFLDDIASYIQSLCYLQECTGDIQYLETARRLTLEVLDNFKDDTTGLFFYTPKFQTDIIFRKIDMYDGATPSGNSLMAYNLFYLGTIYDIPAWKDHTWQITSQIKKILMSYPGSFAIWAQVLQALVYGLEEIAIVGEKHREMSASLLKYFIPNKILQQSATSNAAFPLLAHKATVGNKTNIYLCHQYSCQKPVEDPGELIKMINSYNLIGY
jgi:uncharacterized protein